MCPQLLRYLELIINLYSLYVFILPSSFLGVLFSLHNSSLPFPALFITCELSVPGKLARSKIVICQDGSNFLINVASVALIIPAPINTTCLFDIINHLYYKIKKTN